MSDRGYLIGGLHVASQLALPAMPAPLARSPEIEFRLVAERPELARREAEGRQWAIGGGECLIWELDRLVLRVQGGRRVDVWLAHPQWLERAINYAVGAALAALAMQRAISPFHGSAVAHAGRAMLLLGPSGTGKSTLASALTTLGCAGLADDVCLPRPAGDSWVMAPVIPSPKLRAEAAAALGCRVAGPTADGEVRLAQPADLGPEALPVGSVLLLSRRADAPPGVHRLAGAEAAEAVMRQVYRIENAHHWGRLGAIIADVASLVERANVFAVNLPDELGQLRRFCAETILVPETGITQPKRRQVA